MVRTIACIEGGKLYPSRAESTPIIVGTPAWFDWLERHRAFHFVDPLGAFTASKDDGQSWEAARSHHGKSARVPLGRSNALTLERLQAAAQALAVASHSGEQPEGDPAAAMVGSPSSLLHTKIYRPPVGGDVVHRPRLLERLNAGLGGKATLVSAPAGFGKTTLVAEWVQTTRRKSAWLTLDAGDNELAVFVRSLVAALHTVFPEACGATARLLSAPHFPPPQRIATLLSSELSALPEGMVLVLDDYHRIRTPEVHALLEGLIPQLPSQAHLVLSTRSNPPLPLATWLARGYLTPLGPADLRFTLEETEVLLTRLVGGDLARQTARALAELTGGWIAVLRLAALSLGGTTDAAAFLERLRHGALRSVSRYLLEEVLLQQPPEVQTLLEQLSLLEQSCAELCVALSGEALSREQVQSTLDWLERSHLFLVPLDDRQGWYRLQRLFGGLLRQHLLEHSSPEELAALHRRASAWYAGQGLIEDALQHALAAGDATGAARLVEAHFRWAFEQEGWGQMERWLRLMPEAQVLASPTLLLARAWIMQSHGQVTELPAVLAAAERLLASSEGGGPDQAHSQHRLLQAVSAIIWCQVQYFTGSARESLESARRALAWNPPGEESLASLASMYLALSQQATGHDVVALVTLQEALREHANKRGSAARLLFAQGLVFLAAGKLHQVERLAHHLLKLSRQADLEMSQAWAHWLLGLVQYEWNDLEAAVAHFSAVVKQRDQAHSWTVQEALYGLALAYRALGREAEAQHAARSLLDFVQEQHSQRDLLVAYAFCGQLALLGEGVEAAEPWLALAGEQDELVGPLTSLEVPAVTRAWMLLATSGQANVTQGQAILHRLLQYAEAIHSTRKTIQVLALQARAYALQSRESEALATLEHALALGRPGGFIRTFADLPALFGVLRELRSHRRGRPADGREDAYLKRVLAAMDPVAARAVLREELLRQEGLQPD